MMQKSKSSVWMRSKVLYIIPMATLALSVFATSESLFPSGNVLPIAQEYPSKEKLVPVDEMRLLLLQPRYGGYDEIRVRKSMLHDQIKTKTQAFSGKTN